MRSPWFILHKVVRECDIILEIIDARFPETENEKLKSIIKKYGKKKITVYNKADLLDKPPIKSRILFSSRTRRGKKALIAKILSKGGGKVGVVGLPNVGKSSLINALAGRKAARTSSMAGFTKGRQYIRAHHSILLLDSPGVIPPSEEKEDLVMVNAYNVDLVDPVVAFTKAWPKLKDKLETKYGALANAQKALQVIAEKQGMLKKAGELDIDRAAKFILNKWGKGKEF